MQETLIEYQTVLRGEDGESYRVRSCGREREDGMWEGWLEFVPLGGGEPLISGRETTQPSRDTLLYWATGLTDPYFDGALLRAQKEIPHRVDSPPAPPASPGPAPHGSRAARPSHQATRGAVAAGAVLDPFHVYAEGAQLLTSQLTALSADQLRNIVRQYALSTAEPAVLDMMTEAQLVALIVREVEERAAR